MVRSGTFVRVTCDTLRDEPLVEGMVGKVVADLYGQTDPAAEALVVMAGARKACSVPLEAVEIISELDYGDESRLSRNLWRQRRRLWRKRHGEAPRRPEPFEDDDGEVRPPKAKDGVELDEAELLRRSEAVSPQEVNALASPTMLAILTEWSVGALDILADNIPSFGALTYLQAREVRTDHVERWLWDGVRLYLAVRSFHPALHPVETEPTRERVRALFERIDDGEPAERLAAFSMDVPSVKQALSSMAMHWLDEALKDFAKGLDKDETSYKDLGRYILQLHIVGFQVGFCADATHHGTPAH